MGWFAQKIAMDLGADLVVMGHTHTAKSGLQTFPGGPIALTDYVNCGFECPSKPDLTGNKMFSFAVIKDFDEVQGARAPEHRIYSVTRIGNAFEFFLASPEPDLVVPDDSEYSSYVELTNTGPYPLVLQSIESDTGSSFVVEPPNQVAVGQTRRFWLQDLPKLPVGTGGIVTYLAQGDPNQTNYTIQFLCTYYTSIRNNQFTVTSNGPASNHSFQTKAGGSGWAANQVANGHPLFARVSLGGQAQTSKKVRRTVKRK
jgi:hypothetical protein